MKHEEEQTPESKPTLTDFQVNSVQIKNLKSIRKDLEKVKRQTGPPTRSNNESVRGSLFDNKQSLIQFHTEASHRGVQNTESSELLIKARIRQQKLQQKVKDLNSQRKAGGMPVEFKHKFVANYL